jgi:hypothetical protein
MFIMRLMRQSKSLLAHAEQPCPCAAQRGEHFCPPPDKVLVTIAIALLKTATLAEHLLANVARAQARLNCAAGQRRR